MRRLAAAAFFPLVLVAGATMAQAPQKGGTLVFAVSAEPPTYDCHAGNTFTILHHVSPHYSLLIKFDPDRQGEFAADLAKSWEVSADGLSYTFRLHDNVEFHDGTKLTSADVKASYERIINPPAGIISQRKATLAAVKAVEAPDPTTVVFRLGGPDAALLANIASPWNCIFSKAKLDENPRYPEKTVMGSGPFRFVEHVPGSHWVGRRFEKYFLPDRPYLDGFRAVSVTGAAMINSLAGGQVMGEFRGLAPAERDKVVAARGERIRIIESPNWVQLWRATFNTEKKPLNDVRVRRALNLAVDRWGSSAAIARISFMGPVSGFTPPGSQWALSKEELEKQPGFGRDIKAAREEAKKLLAEAGASNLQLKMVNRTLAMPFTPLGIFLVEQWRQIGVTTDHQQVETAAWQNAQNSGNFDVMLEAMAEHADDPSIVFARYISYDKAPINYSRAIDRKVDSLYEQQSRTMDKAARKAIVGELERHLLQEAFTIPVFWTNRIVAVAPEVQGWKMMPSHFLGQDLRDVSLKQ